MGYSSKEIDEHVIGRLEKVESGIIVKRSETRKEVKSTMRRKKYDFQSEKQGRKIISRVCK